MAFSRRWDESNTLQLGPFSTVEIECPRVVVMILAVRSSETVLDGKGLVFGTKKETNHDVHNKSIAEGDACMAGSSSWAWSAGYWIIGFPSCLGPDCKIDYEQMVRRNNQRRTRGEIKGP
jgi:hypothetical protein